MIILFWHFLCTSNGIPAHRTLPPDGGTHAREARHSESEKTPTGWHGGRAPLTPNSSLPMEKSTAKIWKCHDGNSGNSGEAEHKCQKK